MPQHGLSVNTRSVVSGGGLAGFGVQRRKRGGVLAPPKVAGPPHPHPGGIRARVGKPSRARSRPSVRLKSGPSKGVEPSTPSLAWLWRETCKLAGLACPPPSPSVCWCCWWCCRWAFTNRSNEENKEIWGSSCVYGVCSGVLLVMLVEFFLRSTAIQPSPTRSPT